MEDFVWLEEPLHKNGIKFNFMEEPAIVENLKISFDGAIMAVRRNAIEKHYEEQEVKMIRLGYKKPPSKMKVEDSDTLYKLLSYYVDLE
jgi:hypothetical protein